MSAQATTSGIERTEIMSSGPADEGNTYYVDGKSVYLSYHKGQTTAEVELSDVRNNSRTVGVWMSDQITAVVNGGDCDHGSDSPIPIKVIISNDQGKTWNTYSVSMDSNHTSSIMNLIGFTSKNDGWILVDGGVGCGTQQSFFLKTNDGGKTWTPIRNDIYSKLLSSAVFANDKIGFLIPEHTPELYRTQDGGNTWDTIQLPAIKAEDCFINDDGYILGSPVFNGAKGSMPISYNDDGNPKIQGQYITSDYGKTWTYQAIKK